MKDLSVVVYTMKGCPFCTDFKEMLVKENIEFFDRDIDEYKEEYDLFIHDADVLNKETEGLINLYKTGNNADTALNLFDKYTKIIKNPPLIKQVEASFISKCKGAIIFGTPYDGSAFKYDIKSMYPSIQASTIKFPIDEGYYT